MQYMYMHYNALINVAQMYIKRAYMSIKRVM